MEKPFLLELKRSEMQTLGRTIWAQTLDFLFGDHTDLPHTLRQRLLIANLWVILATVLVTALLLFPLGETAYRDLLAGFTPYLLANIFSLILAYRERLALSLFVYTGVTFVLHSSVLIIMQKFPPHMLLGMVNFILLYGVVLGRRPALIVTFLTAVVGVGATFLGQNFALEVQDFMNQMDFHPAMGWRTESISLATTTFSTGFLVITTVEMQNHTRAKLTATLTQLRQAQTDLEMRHARAEGLAELGAKLAVSTTPQDVKEAVAETLTAGLPAQRIDWVDRPSEDGKEGTPFGSGPETQWLKWSEDAPEDSRAFVQTIADLHDSAISRMNSEARLAAAARMEGVGRLAASVAHDFNNLLVPIRASNDFLELEETVSSRAKDRLNASRAATAQAMALIGKLLTHSRAREGSSETVNLTQLLKATEPLLRTFLSDDVSLTISSSASPIFVQMDSVEVEQVILNLVLNAREAIDKRGTIQVALATEKDQAILTVSDDGPGIPEELHDWVLDAFNTTRAEGTGLGLATVHRIIQESSGTLDISKSSQGGAALTVRLPTVEAPATDAAKPSVLQTTTGNKKLRILIVDDDPIVGDTMVDLTTSLGHEAVLVDSGAEALQRLAQDPTLDLILTDYQMSDLTGDQLLQRLRSVSDPRPLAIITGYGSNLTVSGPHCPDAVIAKPIGRDELGQLYQKMMQTLP